MANTFDRPETHTKETVRELIPEGKYGCRLFMVVDYGTHPATWEGVVKDKHEIYLAWELIGQKMADGRPFIIGKRYTVTNGSYGPYLAKTSNLHKVLRTWLDLNEKEAARVGNLTEQYKFWKSLLGGVPASITIGQEKDRKDDTKWYNMIESIKPYKGAELGDIENKPVFYILGKSKDNPGEDWDKLWPWQQKIVESCNEWAAHEKALDDSIPF